MYNPQADSRPRVPKGVIGVDANDAARLTVQATFGLVLATAALAALTWWLARITARSARATEASAKATEAAAVAASEQAALSRQTLEATQQAAEASMSQAAVARDSLEASIAPLLTPVEVRQDSTGTTFAADGTPMLPVLMRPDGERFRVEMRLRNVGRGPALITAWHILGGDKHVFYGSVTEALVGEGAETQAILLIDMGPERSDTYVHGRERVIAGEFRAQISYWNAAQSRIYSTYVRVGPRSMPHGEAQHGWTVRVEHSPGESIPVTKDSLATGHMPYPSQPAVW